MRLGPLIVWALAGVRSRTVRVQFRFCPRRAGLQGRLRPARWPFALWVIAILVVAGSLRVNENVVPRGGLWPAAFRAVGLPPTAKRLWVTRNWLDIGGTLTTAEAVHGALSEWRKT